VFRQFIETVMLAPVWIIVRGKKTFFMAEYFITETKGVLEVLVRAFILDMQSHKLFVAI
jgi:hypothetical protein